MKKLFWKIFTIFAVMRTSNLTKDTHNDVKDSGSDEIQRQRKENSFNPNFRFEKIITNNPFSGNKADYYFEFSINPKLLVELEAKKIEKNKIEVELLFPKNFILWLENSNRGIYWGLKEPQQEGQFEERGIIAKKGNTQFEQECNKVKNLQIGQRIFKFDLSNFFHEHHGFSQNLEKAFFGFLVKGIDNPPREGYLRPFEAKLSYNGLREDKEEIEIFESKSRGKHGQRIFLRKKLKKINVIQPFQDFVPGFYTAEFTVILESGAIYPIEVIPFSDEETVQFEPEYLRFNPRDYISHSENSDPQQEKKQEKIINNLLKPLQVEISKTFRLKISSSARIGEHKIKFKIRELTVQNSIKFALGSSPEPHLLNYAPIPMIKFNIKNPPKKISSKNEKFNGEIPFIGFKKKYIEVPFEGVSFPSEVGISHAPVHKLELRIDTIRPAQNTMIKIHNENFFIKSGETSKKFFISSKLGAVNGDLILRILNLDYKGKVRFHKKWRRFSKIEIVDFETVHPDINRVEIDGEKMVEDDYYVDLRGFVRDKNEKMLYKNGRNVVRGDLKKRKIRMFELIEDGDEIEKILKGDKPVGYFKNELLETGESKGKIKIENSENFLNPVENRIDFYLSKKAKTYAVILKFPHIDYPSFDKICELIEKFCNREEQEIKDFDEYGLKIVKTHAVYRVHGGWNFIAEFNFDEYKLDRNFEHRVLFITEDRSHLKKMIDFKVITKKKENLNLYQLEFFAVSKSFTYQRLVDILSLVTGENRHWFKSQKKERIEDFIKKNKKKAEERDTANIGHDESNCYSEYIIYFFSSLEKIEEKIKNLKSTLAAEETHLALYNQEPPIRPCSCDILQQVKLKKFQKISRPLEKLRTSLIESKKDALLINFNHPINHSYQKFFNYSAVSEIKERFVKKDYNSLELINCRNGICQKLYNGLKEMKDYIVNVKGCIRYKTLGYCHHGHSKLKAVTQPMIYISGEESKKELMTISFVILTAILGLL